LYQDARSYRRLGFKCLADHWREDFGLKETPDGAAFNDSGLDVEALDEMLAEL